MIRAAARSVANLCIFPMQDVLHLGSEARMNTPAAGAGNWTWRTAPMRSIRTSPRKLAALMEMTDRDGYEEPKEGAMPASRWKKRPNGQSWARTFRLER